MRNNSKNAKDICTSSASRGLSTSFYICRDSKKGHHRGCHSHNKQGPRGTVVISALDGITPEKLQVQLKKTVNPVEEG